MKILSDITQTVGHTPLVSLSRFASKVGATAQILGKLECFNPAGSIKDRVALHMIEQAEQDGNLKQGALIVEATSGNTGIGLASIGIARGYRVVLTMPESMSVERRQLLSAYGAEIVLTPAAEGMDGAVKKAEQIVAQTPGSWLARQFDNGANPETHTLTTAKELLDDTEGHIDALVAGVGTGGTISGIGKKLKQAISNVMIVAVEPASSPLITEGRAGKHGLQGIGANFIPSNFDKDVCDEVLTIADEEAFTMCVELAHTEGILVGPSAGAALAAAVRLADRPNLKGKNIVVILPDGGSKYMSTGIYNPQKEK